MIRRARHVRLSATAGVAGSDTDTLQTDVMRFMSIIGLCLMAVFALVQGIPAEDAGNTSAAARTARLHTVIDDQQQRLQQAQQALADAGQVSQRQLDVLNQQLADSRRQLNDSRRQLARLSQKISTRSPAPAERPPLAAAPDPSAPPVSSSPPVKPRARPQRDTDAAHTVEQQGFSLQFASDAALERLVSSGQVSLFALARQQAWQLTTGRGKAVFVTASPPRWYHEMSARTVPDRYLRSLAATAGGTRRVTWGVQLPAETRASITDLTRAGSGGVLVIRADGVVVLQE